MTLLLLPPGLSRLSGNLRPFLGTKLGGSCLPAFQSSLAPKLDGGRVFPVRPRLRCLARSLLDDSVGRLARIGRALLLLARPLRHIPELYLNKRARISLRFSLKPPAKGKASNLTLVYAPNLGHNYVTTLSVAEATEMRGGLNRGRPVL